MIAFPFNFVCLGLLNFQPTPTDRSLEIPDLEEELKSTLTLVAEVEGLLKDVESVYKVLYKDKIKVLNESKNYR